MNKLKYFLLLNFLYWFTHWLVYLILGYSRNYHIDLFYHSYQYVAPFLTTLLFRYIYKKYKIYRWHIVYIVSLVILTSLFGGLIYWLSRGILNYLYFGKFNHDNFLKDIEPMWVSSYMFVLWNAIYIGFKIFEDYTTQKKHAEKALFLANQAQLEMLRYQLNPHFLFNTFSSLRALIRNKKNDIAESMVTKMSEFLKYSLLEGEESKVPLIKEIKTIRHYFDIEKVRFGDQIKVHYNIDPFSERQEIPVFLIHPLIENAVKHGMKTSPTPLEVSIKTEMINHVLLIDISNTGVWIERNNISHDSGTGLQNTRKRLELAYPNKHNFMIIKRKNGVHIRITINTSYEKEN